MYIVVGFNTTDNIVEDVSYLSLKRNAIRKAVAYITADHENFDASRVSYMYEYGSYLKYGNMYYIDTEGDLQLSRLYVYVAKAFDIEHVVQKHMEYEFTYDSCGDNPLPAKIVDESEDEYAEGE